MRASPGAVLVTYKREGSAETFVGNITADGYKLNFAGADFSSVLSLASEALRQLPGARLIMRREEAPYPMALPENIEEMLRVNLPGAIEALSPAPQRVIVGRPRKANPDLIGTLRYGHDTLADALGDEVYLRARSSVDKALQAEDPATGRWVHLALTDDGSLLCGKLPLQPKVHTSENRWVVARTDDVLALRLKRYYLPRSWNPSHGWIVHESLLDMYEVYRKEKSDVQ